MVTERRDLEMKENSRNDSRNEMEQIQRGLEAFLERELAEMKTEKSGPKLYNLQEEEKVERPVEPELDYEEWEEDEVSDDMEDWDSREHRRHVKESQNQRENKQRGKVSKKKPEKDVQGSNGKRKNRGEQGKPKKKRKSKVKRLLIILLILLALLAGGMYLAVGSVYDQMHYEEVEAVTTEPMEEEGVINVLLIGNDSRKNGEDGRSDAMILLSISSKTKTIYMTSLLRDMYVEIPGYKSNRLNAAYSFGGAELLMDTIEQNFGITLNRYVLVNFEAFANLVDAVGGVELDLTSEEIEYVNGYLVEYNILTNRPEGTDYMDASVSGMVHLNGPQALAYSRNRYLGTDFGRTERQRKVLEAIIKKLPMTLVTNPKELFEGLMTNLTTNLTKEECYWLSLRGATYLGYDIVQNSIPLEGTYKNTTIRNMAVLEVDFEANKQFIQQNIYGEGQQEQTTVVTENSSATK